MTVEFMDYCYNRQNELLEFANSKNVDLKSVKSYLKETAREDLVQLINMGSAWSWGRRCKPDATDENFLWSIIKAAKYTDHLADNPTELLKILGK
jgi:hypothetical protein